MTPRTNHSSNKSSAFRRAIEHTTAATLLLSLFAYSPAAHASKLSWLDDVVREVIADTKAAGKNLASGNPSIRAEALLESRFSRLLAHDPQALRTFSALRPAEKRLVVEMGETAQQLARRYPQEAETMVRQLGPEGLTAVRVFGDDVAPVLAREGPSSIGILRKTGRAGWSFFTDTVLPHKKKLAATGVLAAFLANPEKFVDYAGRATEYAVTQFASAGIQLATAVGGGAIRGLDSTIASALAAYGLDLPLLRYVGMALAGSAVLLSALTLIGLPVRWVLRPLSWATQPFRILYRLTASTRHLAQSPRA